MAQPRLSHVGLQGWACGSDLCPCSHLCYHDSLVSPSCLHHYRDSASFQLIGYGNACGRARWTKLPLSLGWPGAYRSDLSLTFQQLLKKKKCLFSLVLGNGTQMSASILAAHCIYRLIHVDLGSEC